MQKLILKETDNTPTVILDPEQGLFEFSGSSHPENPAKFFDPIILWIEEYAKHPNTLTTVHFKLDYFNSSTTKYWLNVIWGFENILKTHDNYQVVCKWFYKEEDLDALASGERYAQLTTVKFELVKF